MNNKKQVTIKTRSLSKPKLVSKKPIKGAEASLLKGNTESEIFESTDSSQIEVPIVFINIKELKSDALDPVSESRKNAIDKWPLIIDISSLSRAFLRNTDTVYVSTSNPLISKPEFLRRMLIGAIRYGRTFVLDVEESGIELWTTLKKSFDSIQKDLLENTVDKSILKNKNYLKLVKLQVDGDEYKENEFTQSLIDSFQFVLLTSNTNLNKRFLSQFVVYKLI